MTTQTTTTQAIQIGLALGLADGGWWNDCWDALALGPRDLFERVEGYCACPKAQSPYSQAITIRSWLAEQGYELPTSPYDIMNKFGPSPWATDQY